MPSRGGSPPSSRIFLGVLAFVALADRASSRSTDRVRPPRPPPERPRRSGQSRRVRRYRAGSARWPGASLVGAVAIAAGRGAFGHAAHGVPREPGQARRAEASDGAGSGGRRVTGSPGIALVDHLLATEISESHVVIFKARSPVTTYWQVGTLSSFDGIDVAPHRGGERGADRVRPRRRRRSLRTTTLPAPAPTAHLHGQGGHHRLRQPSPPGATHHHRRPRPGRRGGGRSGGRPGARGQHGRHQVHRHAPATTPPFRPTGRSWRSSDPRLGALPRPSVRARRSSASWPTRRSGTATTPAAQAQALVNWFRSGRFRYTLSPPATHGANPLVQFLTVTKAGYCEQFAGAYGVLARTLGIPTRLVVGFTAGPGRARTTRSP